MNVDKMDFNELHEFLTDNFPRLSVHDLSDTRPEFSKGDGMAICGNGGGFPIRTELCSANGLPGYEAGIAVMFTDWLLSIGWHVECYDYGNYELTKKEKS